MPGTPFVLLTQTSCVAQVRPDADAEPPEADALLGHKAFETAAEEEERRASLQPTHEHEHYRATLSLFGKVEDGEEDGDPFSLAIRYIHCIDVFEVYQRSNDGGS